MKIVFSHGKESGPWGFKITRLARIGEARGCSVDSIDYTDLADPDERVERLVTAVRAESDACVLVGSSMGGYVSLVAAETLAPAGLFLIAPALYLPGFGAHQSYSANCANIDIVHGWADDVIPPENSIRFAREADCALHLIPGDHPLNTSIDRVEVLFELWLARSIARTAPR